MSNDWLSGGQMNDTPRFAGAPLPPDRVLSVLAESDLVKTAIAEGEAKKLAERTALAAQLRVLERTAAKENPARFAAADEAMAAIKVAERALDPVALMMARTKFTQLTMQRLQTSLAFGISHDRLEAELRATADPAITAFISEMLDLTADARRLPLATSVLGSSSVERNPNTGAARKVSTSMPLAERINARLVAIRAAITAAEDLRLEPDQTIVPIRLASLRAGLPAVI